MKEVIWAPICHFFAIQTYTVCGQIQLRQLMGKVLLE